MKRLLALFFALTLTFGGLTACEEDNDNGSDKKTKTTTVSKSNSSEKDTSKSSNESSGKDGSITGYVKKSKLLTANSYAKSVYTNIATYLAENETKGNIINIEDISGNVKGDGTGAADEELGKYIRSALYYDETDNSEKLANAQIYIGKKPNSSDHAIGFFVQY